MANDRARQLLKNAKLRVTAGRVALVSTLLQHAEPVSMEDAVRQCGAAGGDPATIYRNLRTLLDAGVLQPVRGVGRREMYELVHKEHAHAHISCTRCGKVECVEVGAMPGQPPAPKGWQAREVSVTVWGLCPQCS
jgi:Fe2+ or Zn2+ uptake regulation protein